ncbi:tape measure protein [Peribacillus muralis]|uniref:tape measure protein n=1 Tax=Peribacillus muralis TaxID=264697 RepID=UPI0038177535
MEKIEGLSIGLDLDSTALNRGLTGVKDKLRTVNSEMKANLSAFDRGDRSIGKYETRLSGLNRKLDVQKEVTKQAKLEYEKMVKEHGEGSKEADKAASSYNAQVAALNNLERYVGNVREELKKLKEEQRVASSGWTKAGDSLINFGSGLKSISDKTKDVGRSLTQKLTLPAVGAASALAGITLVKGFNRLVGIDTARAKLTGLGHDAEGIEKIMESALEAVRGTSFGMDEAATTAANAVAAGVKEGKDLTTYLSLTGDAAAIAGSSMSEMGSILNKVKTSNKAYNGELQQLSDRGLPIYQWLAEEAGVAAGAVSKMASEGEISSEILMKAIENNIGGAAQKMGQTSFTAGLANMWAAVGRIGASFLDAGGKGGGFFSQLKPLIADFTSRVDTMGNFAEKAGVKFGKFFSGFVDKVKSVKAAYDDLSPTVQGVIKKVAVVGSVAAVGLGPVLIGLGTLGGLVASLALKIGPLFKMIAKAGGLLKWLRLGLTALTGPIGITIGVIALLGTGFILLYKNSETFRNGVHLLVGKLKELGGKVFEGLKTAVNAVVSFFKDQLAVLNKFWQENGDTIKKAAQNIGSVIGKVFSGILKVIQFVMPFVLSIIKSIWGNIKGVISGSLKIIMGLVQVFSGLLTGNFSKMWTGIKNIFSGALHFIWNFVQLMFWGKMLKGILSLGELLVNAFKNVWSSISNIFSTVIKWIVDFVKNRFTSSLNTINKIFLGIRNLTGTIWQSIKNRIWTPVRDAVTNTLNKFSNLKSRTSELFRDIKNKVAGYVSDMVTKVKNMPQKMADGIAKGKSALMDGAKKMGNGLIGGIEWGVNKAIDGVEWVLGKLGSKKKLGSWEPKKYAKGTPQGGHKGGLARIGDGNKHELVSLPNGKMFMSPNRDTLVNLPKGTEVLSGDKTSQLFGGNVPAFKNGSGGWLDNMISGTKGAFNKVKDWGSDIWDWVKDKASIGKLLANKISSYGMGNISEIPTELAKGSIKKAIDAGKSMLFGEIGDSGGGKAPNISGDASAWRGQIQKAAAVMRESLSSHELNGIIAQIQRESGGNQRIVQSPLVRDINTLSGNPARGLLQYIPQTFNAYKMKGHNNIYSGYDQLLAFFNNTTWRRDLPYGRRGWGPRGKRKYKNGTGLLGHIGGDAILGDGGKVEPFLMPNGLLGFSPDSSTFFPDLPKGTMVWPSIQDFIKPTNDSYRTDAMKLLALAGKRIQGNKRPHQLPNVSSSPGSEENSLLMQLLEATLKQNQLLKKDHAEMMAYLKAIAEKTADVYLGREKVGSLLDQDQAKRINTAGRRMAT